MVQDDDNDNNNDDNVTTSTNKSSSIVEEEEAEQDDKKKKFVEGSSASSNGNDDDEHDDNEEVDQLAEAFQEKAKVTKTTATTTTDESPNEDEQKAQQAPPPTTTPAIDEHILDAPEELKQLAEWIRTGQVQRILVVTGAGVSVAAGIPDFRSPGTGLYDNLKKYKLPYPEAVFDVRFFAANPQPFIQLASELWPASSVSSSSSTSSSTITTIIRYKPTYTHCFLALLAEKNLLLRVYTQNIDGLDHIARVPDELLMECHGNFRSASCISCQTKALDIAAVQRTIVQDQQVPRCYKCHDGYVKPDIVFFGEGLPVRFHVLLQQDLPVADCCLILGTSLQVAPVSHIPTRVVHRRSSSSNGRRTTRSAAASASETPPPPPPVVICKRVLLNREWVGDDCLPGFGMNPNDDVFHLGDCDESIQILARLLGWQDELQQRYNAIHYPHSNSNNNNSKTKEK